MRSLQAVSLVLLAFAPSLSFALDCGTSSAEQCDGGGSTEACRMVGSATFKCDQVSSLGSGAALVLSNVSGYARLEGTVGSTPFCCTTAMSALSRFEVWGTGSADVIEVLSLAPGHALTLDVRGQGGDDTLYGLNENDTDVTSELRGGDDDDWIFGNMRAGMIQGNAGADTLIGAWGGADTIYGGTENDVICEPDGNGDTLLGEGHDDILYYNPSSATSPNASSSGGPSGAESNTCNNGPGTSWAANCSYTADVPLECASAGVGTMVLFYQFVDYHPTYGPTSLWNTLRSGRTSDGYTIAKDDASWLYHEVGDTNMNDPVYSRRDDGTWDVMAHDSDFFMRWDEGNTCPYDGDDLGLYQLDVQAASGSGDRLASMRGKLSRPVYSGEEDYYGTYYLHVTEHNEIALFRLEAGTGTWITTSSAEADERSPISVPDNLDPAQTAVVIDDTEFPTDSGATVQPLDVTVAQRGDGSWVMYFKGIWDDEIPEDTSSPPEICVRDLYQATSPNLVDWTINDTPVVTSASVPEAYTDRSGRVWLYYQDFSNVDDCGVGSIPAERAPIQARYELDDGTLSDPIELVFDEDFEEDTGLHYATNPTPVLLPDDDAVSDYEVCL